MRPVVPTPSPAAKPPVNKFKKLASYLIMGLLMTMLIVSHEMEIIRRMCPIVTVMIAGQVAAEGTLDEVAAREDVITAYLGRTAA